MASARIRISFAENFSYQATLQTRSLILVPRNDCPTIGTLNDYIRKRFSIPPEKTFKLVIDGFSLPNWESSEIIRENDMLCVHSDDVSIPVSEETSSRGEKRKLLQDEDKSAKLEEHKRKRHKTKYKTEEDSDLSRVSKKNKKAKHNSEVKKSDDSSRNKSPNISQTLLRQSERSCDLSLKSHDTAELIQADGGLKKKKKSKTVDQSRHTSRAKDQSKDSSTVAGQLVSKRKKKCKHNSEVGNIDDSSRNRVPIISQTTPQRPEYSNNLSPESHDTAELIQDGGLKKKNKSKTIDQSQHTSGVIDQSKDAARVASRSEVLTQAAKQPQTNKSKNGKTVNDGKPSAMSQSLPVSQPVLSTFDSFSGEKEKDGLPQLLPPLVNGISNVIDQSQLKTSWQSEFEIPLDGQSGDRTQTSDQSGVRTHTSDQSLVGIPAGDQSELTAVTNDQSEKKKKRRRRKRKNKTTNSTSQEDSSSKITLAVTSALFGTGDASKHLTGSAPQSYSNRKSANGAASDQPWNGHKSGESSAPEKHQAHVKFDSDEDDSGAGSNLTHGEPSVNEQNGKEQTESAGDDLEQLKPSQNDASGEKGGSEIPTEEDGTEKTVVKQSARDYGMYPLLNGPPRTGDVIAFKTLELSSLYCPEISEYKEGVVTDYDPKTDTAEVQLTSVNNTAGQQADDDEENHGRFEMDMEDGWMTECQHQQELSKMSISFSSMIEPRLLP